MIRVRDLEFESDRACAAHFGVTLRHLRNAKANGKLDSIGLGKGHAKGKTLYRDPDRYMPVVVRGVRFENAKACAAHFGIKVCTVYSLVSRGRADSIGLGCGSGAGGNRSIPFTIGGVTYESRRAASLALGLRARYITDALHGKKHASMDVVASRALELSARQTRERQERDRIAIAARLREQDRASRIEVSHVR